MKTRYTQFLTALRNAQQFLDANGQALGTINQSGARRSLDTVTTQIASLSDTQGTHRMRVIGERAKELRLARTLRRRHLGPIVKIARASLGHLPEFSDVTLPPASGNTEALASFARTLAGAAEQFAPTFIEAGLTPGFGDRARAAAEQLVQAIGGKGAHRSSRVQATDGIEKQVRQARRAVSMLDSLIHVQLYEQDPLLAGWRNARAIIQGGGGAAAPRPAATPVPAPAVSASKAA